MAFRLRPTEVDHAEAVRLIEDLSGLPEAPEDQLRNVDPAGSSGNQRNQRNPNKTWDDMGCFMMFDDVL